MASDDQVESPCDDRSRAPSTLRRPIAAAATTAGTVTATKMLMSQRHPRTTHPIPTGRAFEKASSRALSSPVGLVPDSLDADVDPDIVADHPGHFRDTEVTLANRDVGLDPADLRPGWASTRSGRCQVDGDRLGDSVEGHVARSEIGVA